MKGISQSRIDNAKDINLISYVLEKYEDRFYKRKNGELIYRDKKSLVIYSDHAYDFSEARHPYKDSIYVEELISGCTFMEAVERIEVWKKSKNASSEDEVELDLFDDMYTDFSNENPFLFLN